MQAAEGSGIEDVTIDAGDGLIGVQGAAGSGGAFHHLTIVGDRIGINTHGFPPEFALSGTGTQPTPTMAHVTLLNQKDTALVVTSRGPFVGGSGVADRHGWGKQFPSWEGPAAANVKAPPYNARGDSFADDTAAIQRAIDEREIVFLPKGYYRIARPLRLRSRTKHRPKSGGAPGQPLHRMRVAR